MLRRISIAVVLLLFAALLAQRIGRYAAFSPERTAMPAVVGGHEERRLFQSPQGKYTLADIAANGALLPSEKYRGFRAQHDFEPQPGDRLCPITRTKGNPECTWIVDGQTYEFCCPPCIAEFVGIARQHPEQILLPEEYIAKPK